MVRLSIAPRSKGTNMELNITRFFTECTPSDYSASGDNAGAITWQNACNDAPFFNLLDTTDKREAFREFLLSSGGWSQEEITAFKSNDLNALCMQWVAADMREAGLDGADRFSESAWTGDTGRLFCGDDTQVYFYIGE